MLIGGEKMIKKLISVLFATMLFLSACGDADETAQETETKETTQNEEVVDESYKEYSMNTLKYKVPDSWDEKVGDDNLKYYYPENGMLMVGYDEIDGTINNDESREDFMNSFVSAFDSYELISETEIAIEGEPAYQYELNQVLDGEELKTTIILFDYFNGFISFMMGTYSESDANYNDDFETILDSIKFSEEANENTEQKEEGEESKTEEITLGEPLNLGEYTIVIQSYDLAKDFEGNDALIIEYDWVNDSEETTSPIMTYNIKGFQDGVETDHAVMVDGVNLETEQKKVKPGGEIEGAQTTVGISDVSKPLELELDELISFNKEPYTVELDLSELD